MAYSDQIRTHVVADSDPMLWLIRIHVLNNSDPCKGSNKPVKAPNQPSNEGLNHIEQMSE
ncbi:hypothetical protein E2C01_030410 [Portunus trituberculatus]|uniref:Uncharacterized protein n=1 Tax=Portunus trituberculatus TaxID=210409 RepID=A0A5B7EV92_PORTR|nr:hypothetical protein [Portunus trituberculatus]